MLSKLRNYSKIIIIIVAIAMVASGALYGALYGFGSRQFSSSNAPSSNIAEVNGTNITQEEYYSVLRSQAGMNNNLTRSQEIPFKYNVLSSIIDRNLILQEADELGIESAITEEDLNDYINQILEDNEMTEEELSAYLAENNSSLKEFKGQLRENLRINNRIQQVEEQTYSNINVSEEEIINSYEKVQVQVIAKSTADDKDAAKNSINEALEKIKNGGDFTEVANEYTDYNKVDLGMINKTNSPVPDNVTAKAFELEKGQVSDVIEHENAYYIIKVLDKKLASGEDYENAKEEIKENILQQKQNEAFSNWLTNFRAESNITINDPILSGYKAVSNGNYSIAVAELEKALENYPTPMTYVYMAEAYKGNEQQDKAIETFDKAVEEYPEDWELHFNYASLLMDLEEADQEKIIGLLDKASSYAGDNLMAHYQLYMAYSQLGATEKAQHEMEIMNKLQAKMQKQQNNQSTEASQESNQETNNNGEDSAK